MEQVFQWWRNSSHLPAKQTYRLHQSSVNHAFSLTQEKHKVQNVDFQSCCVDLTKAFDTACRVGPQKHYCKVFISGCRYVYSNQCYVHLHK